MKSRPDFCPCYRSADRRSNPLTLLGSKGSRFHAEQHSRIETTARYAHLERDTEKVSAAKVGGSIGADILAADSAEGASWPS